jgi:hypothetical protein
MVDNDNNHTFISQVIQQDNSMAVMTGNTGHQAQARALAQTHALTGRCGGGQRTPASQAALVQEHGLLQLRGPRAQSQRSARSSRLALQPRRLSTLFLLLVHGLASVDEVEQALVLALALVLVLALVLARAVVPVPVLRPSLALAHPLAHPLKMIVMMMMLA